MPSDGRYMYHQNTGLNSQYEYAGYPPSYETTQMAQQQPLRPMRSGPSHSPHPQTQFNPPTQSHSTYQSANTYASAPYGMTQPAPPQWGGDSWAHYNQSFPPPPPQPLPSAPIPDVPFSSGPGRPQAVPAMSAEQRAYPPLLQPIPEPRRNEDRLVVPSAPPGTVLPTKTRRKDRESPPATGLPGTPPGLDFMKLLDSYRLIIDSSKALTNNALSAHERPQPAEMVERMLQSAIYGVQMLESADLQQAPVQDTRPPADREGEDSRDPSNGSGTVVKRQKTEDSPVIEGQTCLGCKATSTPEWRRGPMGPRTLCNACGLVYAKLIKKRVREGTFGNTNGQGVAGVHGLGDESGLASSGDGGSDDEDSYGSQDRRSEIGGA